MTRDEAVKAIDANWPTGNYTMLREALTLAKDALRSRPAPPDDLVRAVEAVLDHDDQHDTLHGTGLAEMLRAVLAAPAPVAAPVPETPAVDRLALIHAAVKDTSLTDFACRVAVSAIVNGANPVTDDDIAWAKRELAAPETPAKCNGQGIECPGCAACETPAPDAMPAPNWIECPNCGGMGTTFHDILVGGTEHDTEERCCEVCKGTGKRRQEAQP